MFVTDVTDATDGSSGKKSKHFQSKIEIYNKKNCKKPVGLAKINQFYKPVEKKTIEYNTIPRYVLCFFI